MEKLFNHEYENPNLLENNIKLALKFRREMLKIAANSPDYIQNFCIMFQKNDRKLLKEFELVMKEDRELKKFLDYNENIWLLKFLDLNLEYKDIFDYFFGVDKKYQKNALTLAEYTNYFCLEFLYVVFNYIDDNFPVMIKRELNKNEKKLIKFLIFYGDEISYMQKYRITEETLKKQIKEICSNYNCKDINHVLNLVLIEKYFRQRNTDFLNEIKKIHKKSA